MRNTKLLAWVLMLTSCSPYLVESWLKGWQYTGNPVVALPNLTIEPQPTLNLQCSPNLEVKAYYGDVNRFIFEFVLDANSKMSPTGNFSAGKVKLFGTDHVEYSVQARKTVKRPDKKTSFWIAFESNDKWDHDMEVRRKLAPKEVILDLSNAITCTDSLKGIYKLQIVLFDNPKTLPSEVPW